MAVSFKVMNNISLNFKAILLGLSVLQIKITFWHFQVQFLNHNPPVIKSPMYIMRINSTG